MENLHMIEAKFIDRKTIQLSEEYPFKEREIRLIVIPGIKTRRKRKAGLLKGKIMMSDDFNDPLDEMKDYME